MLRLCKIHVYRSVSVWNGLLAMRAGWGAITEFIWGGGDHGGVVAESFWGGERGCACFLHEAWSGATFGGGGDLCPAALTVPLTLFYKRHGRGRLLRSDFDRAFDAFLQKARSRTTSLLRF